jgi:hypothetical protein
MEAEQSQDAGGNNGKRTTRDGYDYLVLSSPCSVDLLTDYYTKQPLVDKYIVHHAYVLAKEIAEKKLPIDADPREPSMSPQVKDMKKTLDERPQDFFKLNNGMTMFCEAISYDGSMRNIHLDFGKKEGICNGGHTYFAIVDSNLSHSNPALVHLEIMEFPHDMDPDLKRIEMNRIAQARNNNNRLLLRSEADFLGYYEILKDQLDDQTVIVWHEGDSDAVGNAINAEEYIRFLTAMDPLTFFHPCYHPDMTRHQQAVTGVGAIHTKWFEDMEKFFNGGRKWQPLLHMAPLGKDALELRDHISHTLEYSNLPKGIRRSSFFQFISKKKDLRVLLTNPNENGLDIPPTIEALLLGLFRTDVWLRLDSEGTPFIVGWNQDPRKLWDNRMLDLLKDLIEDFKSQKSDPKAFIRTSGPYKNDLFTEVFAENPPENPELIYVVKSGDKFIRVSDLNQATHYLPPSPCELAEILVGVSVPPGCPMYKKV